MWGKVNTRRAWYILVSPTMLIYTHLFSSSTVKGRRMNGRCSRSTSSIFFFKSEDSIFCWLGIRFLEVHARTCQVEEAVERP